MGELHYGSPAHQPLSTSEWFEWLALITIIEPDEQEQAIQKAKAKAEAERHR